MVSEPFGSLDAEFRNEVYNTLAYHESRSDHFNNKLDQIINTLQTLLTKLQSSRIPHNANTQTKPEIIAISSSSSMAIDTEYSYNPPTHSSSRVTPFAAVYGVPNPKLLSYIPSATKVAIRDLDQFQHRILLTPTCAAASATFKHHHTIHCISSTAVFPLPVFDPGGNGSIEEVGATGCKLGGVSPGCIQISALRTRTFLGGWNDMCII